MRLLVDLGTEDREHVRSHLKLIAAELRHGHMSGRLHPDTVWELEDGYLPEHETKNLRLVVTLGPPSTLPLIPRLGTAADRAEETAALIALGHSSGALSDGSAWSLAHI
jgi:hypothetical protein